MKTWISIVFCTIALHLYTAAPMFHAVMADKWIKTCENYSEKDTQSFFLGTLFPDIRYMANLPRKLTHQKGLTIEDILTIQDPFIKGMKFHSFVDEIRWTFLKKYPLFSNGISASEDLLLKILEDEILCLIGEKHSFSDVVAYLSHFHEEEFKYVPTDIAKKWHTTHQEYFSSTPYEIFTKYAAYKKDFGTLSFHFITKACDSLSTIHQDREKISYVLALIQEFEEIFAKAKTCLDH